jgi:hypothetical protein
MNATSDDVVAYTARRPGLDRLLELLWKRRRKNPEAGNKITNSPETGLLLESEAYGERPAELELIFMSMMWF